jgi:hypothetical protein
VSVVGVVAEVLEVLEGKEVFEGFGVQEAKPSSSSPSFLPAKNIRQSKGNAPSFQKSAGS